jgi:hypothetical protein
MATASPKPVIGEESKRIAAKSESKSEERTNAEVGHVKLSSLSLSLLSQDTVSHQYRIVEIEEKDKEELSMAAVSKLTFESLQGEEFFENNDDLELNMEATLYNMKLICPICKEIVNMAIETSCGHYYCQSCYNNRYSHVNDTTCLVCKIDIVYSHRSIGMDRVIDACTVICPCERFSLELKKWCSWKGPLRDMKTHLLTNCDFMTIQCPQCNEDMFKKEYINDHCMKKQCLKRKVKCELCEGTIIFDMFDEHIRSECMYVQVKCVNHCLMMVEKGQMVNHVETKCPLTLIKCPLGCLNKAILRQDLMSHVWNEEFKSFHEPMLKSMIMDQHQRQQQRSQQQQQQQQIQHTQQDLHDRVTPSTTEHWSNTTFTEETCKSLKIGDLIDVHQTDNLTPWFVGKIVKIVADVPNILIHFKYYKDIHDENVEVVRIQSGRIRPLGTETYHTLNTIQVRFLTLSQQAQITKVLKFPKTSSKH